MKNNKPTPANMSYIERELTALRVGKVGWAYAFLFFTLVIGGFYAYIDLQFRRLSEEVVQVRIENAQMQQQIVYLLENDAETKVVLQQMQAQLDRIEAQQ